MTQPFVLDNSVAMRWCFDEIQNDYAEAVLTLMSNNGKAIVPVLWRYEITSVLSKAQRIGSISEDKANGFLDDINTFLITLDYEGIERIMTDVRIIAVTYGLTGYDAAYLELAIRKNLPIATLDDELRKAAQKAGVELLEP
ncbi:MAG: type II toxin-antitoxin system VapC family toxin [Pseudomonadota bacterium]